MFKAIVSSIYFWVVLAGLFGFYSLWMYNNGKDAERLIWTNKQTESAMEDVEIEKGQNEIRNTPVGGNKLDSLLRSGRFGQL